MWSAPPPLGLNAEPGRELAQRHPVQAVGIEQRDGLADDLLLVQRHWLHLYGDSISD